MQNHSWTSPEFEVEFGHCRTLRELILAVEKKMWSHGQVICEIHLNGLRLEERDEAKFADDRMPDVNSFLVKTDQPHLLVIKTLADLLRLLPGIEKASLQTAELFRVHDLRAAHKNFAELMEMCRYLTDVVHVVRAQLPHARITTTEGRYQEVVKNILTAFESSDFIQMADLLEYDLTNVVLGFKEEIILLQACANLKV